MAFINNKVNIPATTETTVYTPTTSTDGTIIGLTVCPTNALDCTIDIKLGAFFLCKGLVVSAGTTMIPIGGEQKVVVLDTESITVTSNNLADVIVSALEKSNA